MTVQAEPLLGRSLHHQLFELVLGLQFWDGEAIAAEIGVVEALELLVPVRRVGEIVN